MGHDRSPRRRRYRHAAGPARDAAQPPMARLLGLWHSRRILDTAGNLLYIQAASFGRLDVAALVCSLYPGGTILLAGLVLKERPTRRQLAGIALALVSVALLSI